MPQITFYRPWRCLRCGATGSASFQVPPDEQRALEGCANAHQEIRPDCEASQRPEDARLQYRLGEVVISI